MPADDLSVGLYTSGAPLVKRRAAFDLARPTKEERASHVETTKRAIDQLIASMQDQEVAVPQRKEHTIAYTPAGSTEESQLRVVERQNDPLEPPRHRYQKKNEVDVVTKESRAPILRPAAPKLSKEEKSRWHVPQSISNWKNARGYMVDRAKDTSSRASNSLNSINKRLDLTSALADAADSVAEEAAERSRADDETQRLKLKLLAQKDKQSQADPEIWDSRLFHSSQKRPVDYDSDLFTNKRAQTRSSIKKSRVEFAPGQ